MSIHSIKIGNTEHDIIASNTAYGTCSTAAATAAKVITTTSEGGWVLTPGARITIKFTNTNTAKNPTFNVNNTGAKSVWYGTALITTTSSSLSYAGYKNRPMDFIYDGTQYVFMGWSYDTNTTYTNASLGQGYGTCATAAATAAKTVTLSSYTLATGGIVAVKFTYNVPAAATMNINTKGAKAIYYNNTAIAANVIQAGDIATFIYDGTQYHLISIDRWQKDIQALTDDIDDLRHTVATMDYVDSTINERTLEIINDNTNQTYDSTSVKPQSGTAVAQAIGLLEDHLLPVFIGTQAQYNTYQNIIETGTIVIILDDNAAQDFTEETLPILGTSALGQMAIG